MIDRRLSVAPMMDWTDRHERFFLRLISARTLLYTEMVTTGAIIHGDRDRLLGCSAQEHPVAVQLGGSNPDELGEAARIAEGYGYDEINLNVGCPSDRVQSGRFGACLMAEPELVGQCVQAMQAAVSVPVTVKCRLGIDDQPIEDTLPQFLEVMRAVQCPTVTIHARKAWLKGLSPKENREVPPLDYPLVHAMKKSFSDLEIVINGGIKTLDDSLAQLEHVDGVMLGRAAYQTPYVLAEADQRIFGADRPVPTRHQVAEQFCGYIDEQVGAGVPAYAMLRHVLGLFQGQRGARAFRRHIAENGTKPGAGAQVLRDAIAKVPEQEQRRAA